MGTSKTYNAPLDKLVKSSLSKGEVLSVRIRDGAPCISGFGEMDIISGFEPEGGSSILSGPAKFRMTASCLALIVKW